MQIILTQDEIVSAIEAAVRGQINIAENQEISIELRAGRGDNGYTATLDIRPIQATAPTGRAKTKVTTVQEGGPLPIAASTKPAPAAPGKGIFSKPVLAADPEPVAEPEATAPVEEEPTSAGISSGEDRGEAETVAADPAPAGEEAEKPKSIFSFAKAQG